MKKNTLSNLQSTNSTIEQLYSTMAQEADGFYRQMITICTAYLGGTFVFYDKFVTENSTQSLWLLFLAWVALIYPTAVLTYIRWQNVESHRHILEYLKKQEEEEYTRAKTIAKNGRNLTKSAIYSMIIALLLLGMFTALNIYQSTQKG